MFLMGLSTFLMGFSFSVLQRGVQRDVASSGYRVGLLQAANIAGCTLGSLIVGLVLLNSIGTLNTLRALVAMGMLFAVIGIVATPSRFQFAGCAIMIAALAWLLPAGNQLWQRLHGRAADSPARIAENVTGVSALTPEPKTNLWRMTANGTGQSHLPYGGTHSKLGALPAALHPAPRSIAIIGLGSGDTAWASACRTETEHVRVFEICTSEEVVLRGFDRDGQWPQLRQLLSDPRVRIDGRDGRHALMAEDTMYDLIEADAIRHNSAYGGYLYSVEFFQLCARRLNPGGFMCSWAPTSRTYVTFRRVFPFVIELDQNTVLIGSNQPITLDVDSWRKRIESSPVVDYLGPSVVKECLGSIPSARFPDPLDIRAEFVNTDLLPFDEFHE
jgi:spermidine synthase